jgi:hypothetical protein
MNALLESVNGGKNIRDILALYVTKLLKGLVYVDSIS